MIGVGIHHHGGPEVLEILDLPVPDPGPGEVRIRIKAAALNHLDIFVRKGIPGLRLAYPHILGSDASGEIDALGDGIEGVYPFQVGDPVVVNPSLSCLHCRFCKAGEHSLCENYKILGEHVSGTYTQYLVVPAINLKRFPREKMDFEHAAAGILTYLTAWRMLVKRGKLAPGERVLIQGIGGGVAQACLHIARLIGAEVWVTSGSSWKLEKALEEGASWGVLYTDKDWDRQVWIQSNKQGVDVVVDCSGQATFSRSLRLLRPGGRLVTCGATTGPEATIDIRYIFWRQLSIIGSTMSNMAEFEEITDLIFAGKLPVVVDRVFPLEKAAEAHRYLEGGNHFGKVVLQIP